MKITAVTRRAHFSNVANRLNVTPTNRAPTAINVANTKTGRAVPIPYRVGMSTLDSCSTANGMRLPKNSAADTGQNDRANRRPRIPAPHRPYFSIFPCNRSAKVGPDDYQVLILS